MNGLYPDGGYDQIMDRSSYGSYASGYKECPGISIALLLITALGIGWDFKTTFFNTKYKWASVLRTSSFFNIERFFQTNFINLKLFFRNNRFFLTNIFSYKVLCKLTFEKKNKIDDPKNLK